MTTIAEVRDDLGNVLNNVEGWSVANIGPLASGYVGDSVPAPYTFKINRGAFDPRFVMGKSKTAYAFTVTAYAPRTPAELSEAALDALCEPTNSLISAVEDGDNWSVTVDYASVTRCGEVQPVTWQEGVEFLACQFTIEVVW